MFEKSRFIKSVFHLNDLPKKHLPSVILCGRSNVGKSSFINSFFNRKDLAKVSSTPGKTRSINYYEIDEVFYVVDMPGYGYAKTGKSERAGFSKLTVEFLSSSKSISLVIHFIDSRHKPTHLDVRLNKLLKELNIPYIFLLSKVDKLNQAELNIAPKNLMNSFPEADVKSNIVNYSINKQAGKQIISRLFKEMFY
ncbi:MAG: YihA family ribosome biogenesis GTP-binding protein [Ignavibacteriaceae bacterium]|nr:YihA family ribosome biogenesis GTP-binding protein [Ignavibacteriaceae bacterium]